MNTEEKSTRLLRVSVFFTLATGLCVAVTGNLVALLRQTNGFDYEFAGLLLSAISVGGLISIVLSGILPLYIGRRASILFWSVWMVLAYGLLSAGVTTPWLLVVAFLGIGLARGGDANFTSTMMSTMPKHKYQKGFLLTQSSYALGALLSPLILVAIIGKGYSWSVMAVGLLILAVVRLGVYGKMEIPPMTNAKKGLGSVDFSFLKNRHFGLGALMLVFYISVEYGICGWLVTYFQDTGLLSVEMSQLTNSLFWAMMLVGRLLGSQLTTRISPCRLLVVDGLGMTVFFLLMFFSQTTAMVLIGLAGVSFFMATMYPTAYGFGCSHMSGNDLGCGMLSVLPSCGGILVPILVGFVAERGGIQQGMGLLVAFTVLLLATILFTAWTVARKEPTP